MKIFLSSVLDLNPGNDVMCAITALLVETLIYGFVIIFLVTLLIWSTVCFFCVDDPVISEEHEESDYKQPLFYGWDDPNLYDFFFIRVLGINSGIHWHYTRPYLQRVGFPHYFSKRAESLLDICFLVFPTIVVIFVLIPTLGFLYNHEYNIDHLSTAMSIDIVGHQWYWSYEYHVGVSDSDLVYEFSFDSILDVDAVENLNLEVDRSVVIPTDVFISITITSTDVIHSWAVPQLGIKVDAIPGRIASTVLYTFVDGCFYGQCSELCGVLHGFMPICVESVSVNLFCLFVTLNNELSLPFYTTHPFV